MRFSSVCQYDGALHLALIENEYNCSLLYYPPPHTKCWYDKWHGKIFQNILKVIKNTAHGYGVRVAQC